MYRAHILTFLYLYLSKIVYIHAISIIPGTNIPIKRDLSFRIDRVTTNDSSNQNLTGEEINQELIANECKLYRNHLSFRNRNSPSKLTTVIQPTSTRNIRIYVYTYPKAKHNNLITTRQHTRFLASTSLSLLPLPLTTKLQSQSRGTRDTRIQAYCRPDHRSLRCNLSTR